MATLKRLEKRMNDVEDWMKEFEKGTGPAQTMDNMNFLVQQLRVLGDQMNQIQNQNMELNNILQQNHQLLQGFLEENDMVLPWQAHLEAKNKEAQDAVQKQSTETLDVQEQAGDGEEVGEGDSEGE